MRNRFTAAAFAWAFATASVCPPSQAADPVADLFKTPQDVLALMAKTLTPDKK